LRRIGGTAFSFCPDFGNPKHGSVAVPHLSQPDLKVKIVRKALHTALDLVCAYTGWPVGHAYLRVDGSADALVSSNIGL